MTDTTKDDMPSRETSPANAGGVPSWLSQPEDYTPSRDHERFLTKNTLKLTSLLSRMRLQRGGLDDSELSVVDHALMRVDCAFRLLGLIVTIVCISLSTNMFFTYTMLGVFLVCVALKPGEGIMDVLKVPLVACLVTALLMLPAILIGQTTSFVRMGLKVFLSVGFVICLSRTVAYNELIAGLRFYHVPGLIIFVLDMTLKYIVMLGEVAQSVLEALKLRSVGRNSRKGESSAGVMGVTFLKAHDYDAEMYEAMECRGFTGEYVVPRHRVFSKSVLVYLLLLVVQVVYLLFLDGVL